MLENLPIEKPDGYTLRKRTRDWLYEGDRLAFICDYVANNGSLVTLCKSLKIRYSDVMQWINSSDYPERRRAYEAAREDRKEWMIETLCMELHNISTLDVREAFNEDGSIKDIKDMPESVTKALAAFEVNDDGKVKVRFWDKLKAVETLGKNLKMFVDMVEHGGTLTLEQLVEGSIKPRGGSGNGDGKSKPEANSGEASVDGVSAEPESF